MIGLHSIIQNIGMIIFVISKNFIIFMGPNSLDNHDISSSGLWNILLNQMLVLQICYNQSTKERSEWTNAGYGESMCDHIVFIRSHVLKKYLY